MSVKNLDSMINNLSYNMVKDMVKEEGSTKELIRNIDKALGVLVNDGVYAYYVFCKSQSGKMGAKMKQIYIRDIVDQFEDIIELENVSHSGNDKYASFFLQLSGDIHKLLFFKDILERTLVYARYHGKAVDGGE